MKMDKVTSKPINTRDYKKENAEIKRASQYENNLYSLMRQIEHHDTNAIIKAKRLKMLNFTPEAEFAAKLMDEASKYIAKINEMCYDSSGQLSDYSLEVAEETIANDNNITTDAERNQAYSNIINAMETGN